MLREACRFDGNAMDSASALQADQGPGPLNNAGEHEPILRERRIFLRKLGVRIRRACLDALPEPGTRHARICPCPCSGSGHGCSKTNTCHRYAMGCDGYAIVTNGVHREMSCDNGRLAGKSKE